MPRFARDFYAHVHNEDMFPTDFTYDTIVANPPWSDRDGFNHFAKHFCDPGHATLHRFLDHLPHVLKPKGVVYLFHQGRVESVLRARCHLFDIRCFTIDPEKRRVIFRLVLK